MQSDEPNKGLGCLQAVDGGMKREYEHRTNQCHAFANRMRGPRVTLREAHSLMESRVIPSVTYSMPITSFTDKECRNLNKIIDSTMVNKYRYNRHMPRAVMYSPLDLGGADYPCFEVIQDQKGLLNLIKQLRWGRTMANDILVVLSAVQFATGLCNPILMDTATDISYVGKGWFMHIRNRLKMMDAQLWIEHQWSPPLQRQADSSIMERISKLPYATTDVKTKCNMCRLYMKVVTIADLAHLDGKHIPAARLT